MWRRHSSNALLPTLGTSRPSASVGPAPTSTCEESACLCMCVSPGPPARTGLPASSAAVRDGTAAGSAPAAWGGGGQRRGETQRRGAGAQGRGAPMTRTSWLERLERERRARYEAPAAHGDDHGLDVRHLRPLDDGGGKVSPSIPTSPHRRAPFSPAPGSPCPWCQRRR